MAPRPALTHEEFPLVADFAFLEGDGEVRGHVAHLNRSQIIALFA
jgi:hypothetical protein